VMPNTHRSFPPGEECHAAVHALPLQDVPCQCLEAEPGDVVAFDLRLWHASYGGSNDRHMCTVVYYRNPQNQAEEESMRELGSLVVEINAKVFNTNRRHFYSKSWVDNKEGSPTRQYWVDRMTEIGYLTVPGIVGE